MDFGDTLYYIKVPKYNAKYCDAFGKSEVSTHSRFWATHWTIHFVEILADSFFFFLNLLDTVRRPVKYLIKTDCYRPVLGFALARK